MRIAYVYPQFAHQAGTERILIDKMNYLAEHYGYDIVMVTNEQGPHPVAFPLSPKVEHVDLDVRFFPLYRHNYLVRYIKWTMQKIRLQKRYNAFMAQWKPDIVVATTYFANILSLISHCPTPSLHILESHIDKRFILNNDPVNRKSLLRWLHMISDMRRVERNARQFNMLVALNHSDATEWSQFLPTTVISNIVHLNTTGRYSQYDQPRVIFVGRYTEQKGIANLFRVWTIVNQRHPDWHLDLYGEGNLQEWMEEEVRRSPRNIHIHPPTHSIFDCYCQSSILVLTSVYEPFGLVMPEAMSCGLPVVAFNCPSGPASIITDGVDGFLVDNGDYMCFADCVCQLIDDHNLCRQMGQHAIAAAQRYHEQNIMPQWKDLFEHLNAQSS